MKGKADASDDCEDPQRRLFVSTSMALGALALGASCTRSSPGEGTVVNDITGLNPIGVARVARPHSADEVAKLLQEWKGTVSIGGSRCSMGGQIASERSLHLDMRAMRKLLRLDPTAGIVRVQAGMRWRDLQDHVDPHDLSVRIMQSYSNFSIGGSLSVNCHGRYVGKGPLANSIRALRLATVDGRMLELSRISRPELFGAVIGGYGGLGVVTEVELDLDRNRPIRRDAEFVALEDYPGYFRESILADPTALLHNADLSPPDFDRPLAITWRETDERPTGPRLVPRNVDYSRDRKLIWAASELPGGAHVRERFLNPSLLHEHPVVWRNHEASLDIASLEPGSRFLTTYALQEYFLPVGNFVRFAQRMAGILREHEVNVLNVSLRHTPADEMTLMRWAPAETFCFVLYYKQGANALAQRTVQGWTRALIDAALELGGRYYLPYQLHATTAQFRRAYPEHERFAAIKAELDPNNRLRNKLWEKYLPAAAGG